MARDELGIFITGIILSIGSDALTDAEGQCIIMQAIDAQIAEITQSLGGKE